jgi:hypothetical protein
MKLYVSIRRTQDFEVFSHAHGGIVPAKHSVPTQTHAKFSRRGIGEDKSKNMFEEIPLSLVTKFVQTSSWRSNFTLALQKESKVDDIIDASLSDGAEAARQTDTDVGSISKIHSHCNLASRNL